ncbi:hypothetical protein PFUGPA_05930 [Plasmodium falciparum Palo Alto/Uganda]|uniref:Rifin n=1 Tax=Plasmodium falciparum (isolate Palo Alto / Uganda) TaxID=57270 RepID=W4IS99_PLAFP|nr:hypothetical protein PFUGPA_05930 [Plasmodium falciparum Palo Alto/Uganda]
MKVHYINILLLALSLNILANTHQKPSSTPRHIQTTRLLCECELYMHNYDNDPEMKRVMQQFHDRTTQRFQEYDERLQEKRQVCKDTCDKEIEKIILKDKIEKELNEKFATLQTDIHSDAIPTCICKTSMADKVEKTCLKCTQNLGGIVAPSSGVLAGIAEGALYAWKPNALQTAIEAALKAAADDILVGGIEAGKKVVIGGLDVLEIEKLGIGSWEPYFTEGYCINVKSLASIIYEKRQTLCGATKSTLDKATCEQIGISIGTMQHDGTYGAPGTTPIETVLNGIVEGTKEAADVAAEAARESATNAIKVQETRLLEAGFNSSISSINASIIAIVVIILIMVIIYFILRYRRKKKLKKKLQYIKLLEE